MDRLKRKRIILLLLLIAAGVMTGYAQNECFTFSGGGTTITGLTYYGMAAEELIIPAEVTTVVDGSFADAQNVTSLTIDGGNPTFEGCLFGEGHTSPLTDIDMGSGMSVNNMKNLLLSVGSSEALGTVVIGGYFGGTVSWKGTDIKEILTEEVRVILPATLVADQVFGDAKVYGRFSIDKELISFCGSADFRDTDNGSNMLFYVADRIDGQRIHIQRVRYVVANRGLLIHKSESGKGVAYLERITSFDDEVDNGVAQAVTDNGYYTSNMLVGVTSPTPIDATEGNKTNLVLKDAAFHPTSGGTIKANRAYLQIPTADMPPADARLEIAFPDDDPAGISDASRLNDKGEMTNDHVYDLQGCRVNSQMVKSSNSQIKKGLYIVNGRKVVMK